ncbi:hypothetical protein [Burkholderia ubonensis]|uniref:Baseplate protein J-like domain-containing protein n=1 Tax=Burkholderia ubonensis TaxID=101571 RepID=A0ABD4DZM8_9BURK|nr:hypothetical protein [Burkholderia ubonensis]KVN83424.1 hypothetical protein WJ68_16035 [Burkholderia ubonensis]
MALTRDDLFAAVTAEAQNYPAVATYLQAGDPRITMSLGAMAAMLAMVSSQIDVESVESFNKTRDTTVLADAAMKGILPFARPPRVVLAVKNPAAVALSIVVGRRLLDSYGRVYVAESAAAVPAGGTGTVSVKQVTTRPLKHIVSDSVPFYSVQIPANDDAEQIISGLYVTIAGVLYPYTPEFANLAAGQPGYVIETDELRQLWVRFGWDNTFGIQPANGVEIDIVVEETCGALAVGVNAPFTLETTVDSNDRQATFSLQSVTSPGADPVDIDTLRQWANVPPQYDANAVYLGNFDALIRRNLPNLSFLSVWNEDVEESVRGAKLANINKLFVAFKFTDGTDTTWARQQIRNIVAAADDSYIVSFVSVVDLALPVTIAAQVSVVHDPADVKAQIQSAALKLYGQGTAATKQGMLKLSSKKLSDAIKTAISALQDDGSDYQITLPDQAAGMLPEQCRFVTADSLTINVTQATYNDGMWSH